MLGGSSKTGRKHRQIRNFAERGLTAISNHNICKANKGIGGRSEANFLICEALVREKAFSHHCRVSKRKILTFWRYFNQLKGVRNLRCIYYTYHP